MDKPQIIIQSEKSVPFNVFDGRWIPCSAKFVILGHRPKGHGVIQIYELTSGEPNLVKETDKEEAFRCSTFGASSLRQRHLATGNNAGRLDIWNLEDLGKPVETVAAHGEGISCIDGIGGQSVNCGAPEIVTGSSDGLVKLWDPRTISEPVVTMEPFEGQVKRDCWSVTFGNSYNNSERVICAGYDNGDIKMFDLKKMSVRWETNVKNGVCSLEFDRKDIEMNKLVATTLESKFFVFDTRTQHSKKGFASLHEKAHSSTVWTARHLPQNRDLFMTSGGNGTLCLWKYCYPSKRTKEDMEGEQMGVMGNVSLLQNSQITQQPVSSFNWSADKQGLALATSFDQAFRVLIVTRLNLHL